VTKPASAPDPLPGAAPTITLQRLEAVASGRGLKLRLRTPRRLGVWGLRVVVARPSGDGRAELLGELKGWALASPPLLQLDTMRVQGADTAGVGALIWAATFAWALECTPCRRARLLAIRDNERQHQRLVRYFQRLGFEAVQELGCSPTDLALRLIWGGSGLLMGGDCAEGLARSGRLLGGWAATSASTSGAESAAESPGDPAAEPGQAAPSTSRSS
jgi:hypothetical protein